VNSGFFANEYFAPRPYSEKLINLKLSARGINYMKDWRICLEDYVEIFKPHLEKGG
jgi:dTDP-4-dehydrorhamnose reductase